MRMSILAGPGGSLREVAREVGKASSSRHVPRAPDLLLDGLVKNFTEGYAAAVPIAGRPGLFWPRHVRR